MTTAYFTIDQYIEVECMQMEEVLLGAALHALTGGRMCKGCPKHNSGSCISLRKMQPETKKLLATHMKETVREEAIRRNIGIKEVRRQRQAIINKE